MKKLLLPFLLLATTVFGAATGEVSVGEKFTISVDVKIGTAPFTYQWAKNGVSIPGATQSSYVVQSATLADSGTYAVKVVNSAGSTISDNAVVTVKVIPPGDAQTSFSKG